MNLQPVNQPGTDPKSSAAKLWLKCVRHNHLRPSTEMFADLDGKPFESYYCNRAVDELLHMTAADRVLDILSRTHDGDDLCKRDLKLTEMAVNGMLNAEGLKWLASLHSAVMTGYSPDWMTELKPDATTACNP